MATKYCDHGLYGASSFTANTTNSNATLTVTAQASGTISLGQVVSGTGIPANTYISAYGTGRGVYPGSSVTYTMSNNATATNTGITVTGSYGNISLDPSWGVAQDGDGGHGSGAVLSAVRTGNAVSSVTITAGGSGYSTNTLIWFSGGGGSGATATITSVDASGGITGISVGAGGSGYTANPTVVLAAGAAIPATVSVDMSGWTFVSGSSTFSVMGCTALTITGSANSATNAQYSATYSTMLANIVAAINLATASCVNVPAGWRNNVQVRDQVFARASGNNLQLMTRAGSASWNSLVALSFTNVTGSSSQSWANGASGAWGTLMSLNGTTFPSAIAVGGYGLWATALPNAGILSAGDVVNVRSAKTIKQCLSSPSAVVMTTMGTVSQPIIFKIDDSSVWPDGANPTLTIDAIGSSVAPQTYTGAPTAYCLILAPFNVNSNYYGLRSVATGSGSRVGGFALKQHTVSGVYVEGTSVSTTSIASFTTNTYSKGAFKNAKIVLNSASPLLQIDSSAGLVGSAVLENIIVDNGTYASPHPGLITNSAASNIDVIIKGVEFRNFVTGSTLFASQASGRRFFMRDISLGAVSQYGAKMCQMGVLANIGDGYECVVLDSLLPTQAFIWDSRLGFCEWNPARSFPTLNATLPSGGKYSMRAFPTTVSGQMRIDHPWSLPQFMTLNSNTSDAAATFTVHLAIKSGLSLNKSNLWAVVRYVNASNEIVELSSYNIDGGSLTSDSGVTWSQESGGQVTYDDGGLMYFDKYKIVLNTTSDLKAGSLISTTIRASYTAATVTEMFFYDPELQIT